MTVRELIEALKAMPQDIPVTRYCDDIVREVELRDFHRDEGVNSEIRGLPDERHVALW